MQVHSPKSKEKHEVLIGPVEHGVKMCVHACLCVFSCPCVFGCFSQDAASLCALQVKPLIWVESVIERHQHSRVEYMIKVSQIPADAQPKLDG